MKPKDRILIEIQSNYFSKTLTSNFSKQHLWWLTPFSTEPLNCYLPVRSCLGVGVSSSDTSDTVLSEDGSPVEVVLR